MRVLIVAVGLAVVGADAPPEGPPLAVETDDLAPEQLGPGFSRDDLPPSVLKLDGHRVTIRGSLYPTYKERVSRFILIGETAGRPLSLWKSAGPVHQLINVRLAVGDELETKPFESLDQPMAVEGRFVIDIRTIDGIVVQLYRIEEATIRPEKRRAGYQCALGVGC